MVVDTGRLTAPLADIDGMRVCRTICHMLLAAALTAGVAGRSAPARAADAAFRAFVQGLAPEAQKLGVARATFDAETRDLEPDYSLPDLVIPGRPERAQPGQAEFVQAPADYVRESAIAKLAEQGRKLASQHAETLAAIEKRYGVAPNVLLAIWGRETGYGTYKVPYDALRVLATQAYVGRRKQQFRGEFLAALKMLQDGHATRADLRSSWAGAMGLTQFLPSDFYRHGVDFDGDGRVDLFHSVPDALASTARQLLDKGWQPGKRWAYEVRAPADVDCTLGDPDTKRPIGDWLRAGFVPAYGRKLTRAELAEDASLLLPAGIYGPAFLTPINYFVIKQYNVSDLYVLFVGHLADRIADPRPFETPWGKVAQLPTAQVEAMQRNLTERGLYREKLDGKAGMKTRLALGAYQKASGLKLDCWPTTQVLRHMQSGAGAR